MPGVGGSTLSAADVVACLWKYKPLLSHAMLAADGSCTVTSRPVLRVTNGLEEDKAGDDGAMLVLSLLVFLVQKYTY